MSTRPDQFIQQRIPAQSIGHTVRRGNEGAQCGILCFYKLPDITK